MVEDKSMIKIKLEETRPHALEKKVYERELPKEMNLDFYDDYDPTPEQIDVLQARANPTIGIDITTEPIDIRDLNIRVQDHYVPIRMYQSKGEKHKAIVYIHGGGFIGGQIEDKDAQCKYMAQMSDAVIISVGYRLAPETMYPGAIEDCLGVLDWVDALRADRVIIGGDSAGGNLAACCMARRKIDYGFLIYAALDLSTYKENHWNYRYYDMGPTQISIIKNRLYRFRNLAIDMKKLYLPESISTKDPLVSPLYLDDVSMFPPVLMIEAEFDYYRPCNQAFEKKLSNCEVLYYEGLDHGFFDRIGQLEQAKDCIDEIAKRVKAL